MRIVLIAFVCLLFAGPLGASTIEREAGDQDCRVIFQGKGKVTSLRWSGGCQDGYAEGSGMLEWKFDGNSAMSRYEGEMKKGRWHGNGYLELAGNLQYEGGFSEGMYHGEGILVSSWGRYDGGFVAGKADGFGKSVRTMGGTYEGMWKAGTFHGKGTVTYTGGRTITTEFVDGRPASQPISSASGNGFQIFGRRLMTAAEKQNVRHMYFLDDDDEPPEPTAGKMRLYQRIAIAQHKRKAWGLTELAVLVDSEGKATSVTVFATPDPEMTKWISGVVLMERFDPGLCQGKPCTMQFPVSINNMPND